MRDVHRAGAGLCLDGAVEKVSREGPGVVEELLLEVAKVPFDREVGGELKFCLEASHSAPRIIHYADATGKAITESITRATASHPLITPISDTLVTDLVTYNNTCLGIHTLNTRTNTSSTLLSSRGVVLGSGGLANTYLHSTNPPGFNALGSSVSTALRAGVLCEDLEYVQFHPTALYIPGEARFLLTEALRGEGAVLRDGDGRAFAKDFHEDGELAPRDIVARGVFEAGRRRREDGRHNVYLDITHRDGEWLKGRFPTIQEHLMKRGLDMTKDCLPVVPAAHYTCGGVATDLLGRTSVTGLYAAGEAARTGLHGGNRLASTSLLEGLVFGAEIGNFVGREGGEMLAETGVLNDLMAQTNKNNSSSRRRDVPSDLPNVAKNLLKKVRETMWDKVGVVRTSSGTKEAVGILGEIREEACELFERVETVETVGLRDAVYSGEAVAKAASENMVSAGAHYMIDGAEEEEDSDLMQKECSL